jgi:hypothetical protein
MEVKRCTSCGDWIAELDDEGHLLRLRLYATASGTWPEVIDGRHSTADILWPHNTGIVEQVRCKCGSTFRR